MSLLDPLHGLGLGTFHLHYPNFRLPADDSQGFWVHMDPLQWAVETGWITPIIFYTLVGLIVFQFMKIKSPDHDQISAAAFLIFILIHIHFNYSLHIVPIMICTMFALSLLSAPPQLEKNKLGIVFSGLLIISICCVLWNAMRTTQTLYLFQTKDYQSCLLYGDRSYQGCSLVVARGVITEPKGFSADDSLMILGLLSQVEFFNPHLAEVNYYRAKLLERTQPDNKAGQFMEYRAALGKNLSYWPARRELIDDYIKRREFMKALVLLREGQHFPLSNPERVDQKNVETELLRIISGIQ
jgi:hypothetical protein